MFLYRLELKLSVISIFSQKSFIVLGVSLHPQTWNSNRNREEHAWMDCCPTSTLSVRSLKLTTTTWTRSKRIKEYLNKWTEWLNALWSAVYFYDSKGFLSILKWIFISTLTLLCSLITMDTTKLGDFFVVVKEGLMIGL